MNTRSIFCLSFALLAIRTLGADRSPGFVIGWGDNGSGQATGIPSLAFSNGEFVICDSLFATGTVRVASSIVSNAVAIVAGASHSAALRGDGTVVGWGDNSNGQAVGFETAYPCRAAGVVKTGDEVLSNIVAVAVGEEGSLALKGNGGVVAWGCAPRKGLASVPTGLTNVVAIAAGGGGLSYGLALQSDGTVTAWGGVNPPPGSLSDVVVVSASRADGANLALKGDGTVVEWPPRGVDYVSRVPRELSNVVAVAAGAGHCLALKRDGTVRGWGFNAGGEATGIPTKQPPYEGSGLVAIGGQVLSHIVAVAAGTGHSLALKSDSTVVAWGRMNHGLRPATVPEGLSNVVAIAAGENFCLAITTNPAVAARFMPPRR